MKTVRDEYFTEDTFKPKDEVLYNRQLAILEAEAEADERYAQLDSDGNKIICRTNRDTIRFFLSIAINTGSIPLSALVFHVVGWTQNKRKNDPDPATWDPTSKFAEALGLSVIHTRRLIKQACDLGYLRCVRGYNKIYLYVKNTKLCHYKQQDVRYYCRKDIERTMDNNGDLSADRVSITEAILISKFNSFWESGEPNCNAFRTSPEKLHKQFPCFTVAAIRRALYRLKERGFLDWNSYDCYAHSHAYFCPLRTAKDKVSPMTRVIPRITGREPALQDANPDAVLVRDPQFPTGTGVENGALT